MEVLPGAISFAHGDSAQTRRILLKATHGPLTVRVKGPQTGNFSIVDQTKTIELKDQWGTQVRVGANTPKDCCDAIMFYVEPFPEPTEVRLSVGEPSKMQWEMLDRVPPWGDKVQADVIESFLGNGAPAVADTWYALPPQPTAKSKEKDDDSSSDGSDTPYMPDDDLCGAYGVDPEEGPVATRNEKEQSAAPVKKDAPKAAPAPAPAARKPAPVVTTKRRQSIDDRPDAPEFDNESYGELSIDGGDRDNLSADSDDDQSTNCVIPPTPRRNPNAVVEAYLANPALAEQKCGLVMPDKPLVLTSSSDGNKSKSRPPPTAKKTAPKAATKTAGAKKAGAKPGNNGLFYVDGEWVDAMGVAVPAAKVNAAKINAATVDKENAPDPRKANKPVSTTQKPMAVSPQEGQRAWDTIAGI